MPLNDHQHNLLESWKEDANVLLYANFAEAERSRRRNNFLGAASSTLSTIVGTAVFASIGKDTATYVQVITGLVSILAAVLAALHTFLNLSEIAARHQKAGAGYASLRKRIEQLLAVPPNQSEELRTALTDIQHKWDELRQQAVPMSAKTLRNAAKR